MKKKYEDTLLQIDHLVRDWGISNDNKLAELATTLHQISDI